MRRLGAGVALLFAVTADPAWAGHLVMGWGLQMIEADQLKTLLDKEQKLVLVDVRSPEEFQKGHIPGARLLSLDEPGDRFRELPRREVIVLYCSCPLSEIEPAYLSRGEGGRVVKDLRRKIFATDLCVKLG
jgi:rhodanese-related sulfurtransferase